MIGNFDLNQLKSWRRISCLFTVIGIILFIILTIIAMFTYPVPYSFAGHHFSTLGVTHTDLGGFPNPVSMALFITALTIVAILLIPFWVIIRELFLNVEKGKISATIGSFFGICCSPLIMGVAIFPADVASFPHSFSANGFFLSFALAIVLYSVAILMNQNYPNFYSYLGIGISIMVVLYVFNVFAFADALFQKICVYSFIIWAMIQIIKVWQDVGP